MKLYVKIPELLVLAVDLSITHPIRKNKVLQIWFDQYAKQHTPMLLATWIWCIVFSYIQDLRNTQQMWWSSIAYNKCLTTCTMEHISNNIDQDIQNFAGAESGVLGKK